MGNHDQVKTTLKTRVLPRRCGNSNNLHVHMGYEFYKIAKPSMATRFLRRIQYIPIRGPVLCLGKFQGSLSIKSKAPSWTSLEG